MLLSAVSVLVVVQSSSEIPEGLMNNPVYSISCMSVTIQNQTHVPMNFVFLRVTDTITFQNIDISPELTCIVAVIRIF